VDTAGNVDANTASQAVTIDTSVAAPTIISITDNVSPATGTVSSGGSSNDTTPTLAGTAEANSTVSIYDGATLLGTTAANGSGAWSFTTSALSQGSHSFTATATDKAGNLSSASAAYTETIDTTPPPAAVAISAISPDSGSSSSDFITNHTTLTVTGTNGTLGSGESVQVSNDGGTTWNTATQTDTTHWSFTDPTTHNSSFTYQARIVDTAGNVDANTASQAVTIDTTAPAITNIVVAGDDDLTRSEAQAGFSVTGNASGANGQLITVEIRDLADDHLVDSRTGTVDNTGAWSVSFSGNEAINGTDNYSIHASVSDIAGNLGTTDHSFTTDSTVCFMPGTRILTPAGEVAVEALKRGDLVTTADGQSKPIRWVGRQTVSRLFADPLRVLPIRITQGALGDNMPSRDLLVSPDHALLVDGALIQAGALVNGTSIVRETKVPERFTYYHVELADHSLILADNTPAETFIDNVDRMAFDNWDEHEALPDAGDMQLVEMSYPRAKASRQVPRATRDRLARRAEARNGLSQVA
jgi:hypothetical protein